MPSRGVLLSTTNRNRLARGRAATVNWEHPLARGLSRCWLFHGTNASPGYEVATRNTDPFVQTRVSADTFRGVGPYGVGWELGASASDQGQSTLTADLAASDDVTLIAIASPRTGANTWLESASLEVKSVLMGCRSGVAPLLGMSSTGFYMLADGPGTAFGAKFASAPTTNQWYVIVGTKRGTSFSVYVDGALGAVDNYAGAGSFTAWGTPGVWRAYQTTATTRSEKKLAMLAFVKRAWTAAEVAHHFRDPFGFLQR